MDIRGLTSGNWIKETNRFDYDERQPMADLEFQIPEHASFIVYKKEDYQPIPLTEEWLMKFGFEYKGEFVNKVRLPGGHPGDMDGATEYLKESEWTTVYVKDGEFHYQISNCSDDISDTIETRRILAVHQLQNLHYALTGEELKINSEKTANIE